jgi:hypothetical protein
MLSEVGACSSLIALVVMYFDLIAQKAFNPYTRQETGHQTTKEPSLMLGKRILT